jgi:hypothetical protein
VESRRLEGVGLFVAECMVMSNEHEVTDACDPCDVGYELILFVPLFVGNSRNKTLQRMVQHRCPVYLLITAFSKRH